MEGILLNLSIILILLAVSSCTPLAPGKIASKNKLRDVDWFGDAQKMLNEKISQPPPVGLAKNVILFIGDGMGINTVTAARILKAQQEKKSFHETSLSWERFPYTSLSATYSIDHMISDSAATATAILTGVKTNGKMLGVDQQVRRGNCSTFSEQRKLKSILKYSHDEGKWTGIVTNTRITHATPGAAYANSPDRGWESDSEIPDSEKRCKDIAKQLVEDNDFIRVLMGGGRENFMTESEADPEYPSESGVRRDGVNLIKKWEANKVDKKGIPRDKVKVVTDQAGFDAVKPDNTDYLLGLFEPSHMQFEVERNNEPSLAEMVTKAIKILKRSDKGYFLLVEGGRIDKGHHLNKAYKALTETLALSEAVDAAVKLTSEEDTLIVTTADHSQSFVMTGYTHPDVDIMGISRRVRYGAGDETDVLLGKDDLPWLTLTYINGPGYTYHRTNGSLDGPLAVRRNLTQDDASKETRGIDYLQDAGFPRKSGGHAGEDVAVFARGPMSHLFRGSHEQNYIAHVMMYASCVGPNKGNCKKKSGPDDSGNNASCIKTEFTFILTLILTLILQ